MREEANQSSPSRFAVLDDLNLRNKAKNDELELQKLEKNRLRCLSDVDSQNFHTLKLNTKASLQKVCTKKIKGYRIEQVGKLAHGRTRRGGRVFQRNHKN